MLNQEYKDALHACSVQALREDRSIIRQRRDQERRERIEDAVEANKKSTLPMVEELKSLVAELQEQNSLLKSQIDEARKDSEEAKKEAKRARIFSWVSFGITTAIAVAALVVSIISILL